MQITLPVCHLVQIGPDGSASKRPDGSDQSGLPNRSERSDRHEGQTPLSPSLPSGGWRRLQRLACRILPPPGLPPGLLIGLLITVLIGLLLPGAAYSASKTLLVLGDSISAEYGLPRGEGWVARLQQRCEQQKIAVTLVNASISGETTSGGKTRLPALLAQHHPDIVLIELGGNDGLRGLALSDTTANLRSMVSAAQQSKARVMLIGMRLPPNFGRTYTEQFFAQYAALAAQYQTALVPFLLAGVAEKPELFQADRIHPNVTAQNLLLENVWPHLQPMLQSSRTGTKQAGPATTGK